MKNFGGATKTFNPASASLTLFAAESLILQPHSCRDFVHSRAPIFHRRELRSSYFCPDLLKRTRISNVCVSSIGTLHRAAETGVPAWPPLKYLPPLPPQLMPGIKR